MINGNSVKVQFAVETEYGTAPSMAKQIRIASEGFKYTPDKKEEGLLTGGKSSGRVYTTSIKAEGALSTNVRPDEVGYFLGCALGVEAAVVSAGTTAKKHTFTAIDSGDSLPSLAFTVDRTHETPAYVGCKIQTLAFSAAPGDYLKVDLSLVGKNEVDGTIASGLTVSPLKPFRFAHGKVKVDGSEVADITDIKFDYNNNLTADVQTTSTGLYFKEPEVGMREITMTLEAIYTADTNAIRDSYFKTDNDLEIELSFTSEEEVETGVPYSLTIDIPHAQVSEASPANASGVDMLKQSFTVKAIEEGNDALITVELINGLTAKYI